MPDYSRYRGLEVTQDGKNLTVALNRPDRMNAIDNGTYDAPGLHQELEEIWARIGEDDSVGAVILTGNGRAFCAGGDVKTMADPALQAARLTKSPIFGYKRLLAHMLEVEQPIIAAINGPAIGLGATLALFCDISIMAEDAYICDTHVNVGLVAGDGGAVVWPLILPINQAKYYLMTGERIPGAMAKQLGLVNQVVPAAELLPAARALAERFAYGPILAVRWTKTAINKVLRERLNLIMDTSITLEMLSFQTQDHKEAARAFVEKRPPEFHGR
jgi:enoyl-CoA hydratase